MTSWRQELWSVVSRGGVVCVCRQVDVEEGVPSCLSGAERERAAQFRSVLDRACFCAGRALLRQVLIPGVEPQEVDIRIGTKGKPECPDPRAFEFNLSHAAGWVAVALSGTGPVGVDLESPERRVGVEKVATRFFSEREQAWVHLKGREGFFQVWTRKEARLKAEGSGISVSLAKADTFSEEAESWHYQGFRLPEGPLGCLATPRIPPEIRVWLWFPEDERLQSL